MINELLLNNLEGQWKYQQTIYNINNKTINCHINNFFLQTNCTRNIVKYQNNKLSIIISIKNNLDTKQSKGNLCKTYNNNYFEYSFLQSTQNKLNIRYTKTNIVYDENFDVINPNFFVSKILIKKKDKYLAVIFTSYIKIIENE